MKQIYPLSCRNDILFKYLFSKQVELLYVLIEYLAMSTIESLSILNPEIIPNSEEGRKGVMDILVQDHMGNLYDIEMQNGSLTEEMVLRFEYYAAQLHISQFMSGKKLSDSIKHIYVIVLLNDGLNYNGLIRHDIKNVDGNVLKGIRQHLVIINMPYINTIAQNIGIEYLNSFERIIYALYNNLNDDILNLKDRLVNQMNENRNVFLSGYNKEADWALKWELLQSEELDKQERIRKWEEQLKSQEEQLKSQEEQLKSQEEQVKAKEEKVKTQEEKVKTQQVKLKLKEDAFEKKELFLKSLETENNNLKSQKQIAIENIMTMFNISYEKACALFSR